MGIKTVYIIPEYPRPCQSPVDFIFESEDSLSTLWIRNIGQLSRTLGFRVLSSVLWVPSLLPAWASLNQHLSESKNPSQTNPANKRQWPAKGMPARREFCICERFLRFQFKISAGIREVRVLNGF